MDSIVDSYMDLGRILNGFRADSCMESHMDSEFIHNGFAHGLIIDSESIHTWIHACIQDGVIGGIRNGFLNESENIQMDSCMEAYEDSG